MTDLELDQKVSELLEYTNIYTSQLLPGRSVGTDPKTKYTTYLPRFSTDLNACVVFKKRLEEVSIYYSARRQPDVLYCLFLAEKAMGKNLWDNGTFIGEPLDLMVKLSHVTARQKCEVFIEAMAEREHI